MTMIQNNCISAASRELTDADLVRRALDGDVGAFDCLVLRHRAGVLYSARACVRDWEQAEDVAQQAFIEAYKSLRGLREGASFRAWLMTITTRCASRHRASQPDAIELTEAVMCSFAAPITYPGIDEVTENVRASLSELSARSRQVVTLHYLDGYSCKEIGGRLGVPTGTVKRILHESRNSLRSRMGITKGAIGRMEVLDRTIITKGPRHLHWWITGEWPGSIMSSLLSQSIALTTNKKPMTAAEIGKAIDANIGFVEEALEPLVREELVTKSGRNYSTNFIAFDAEDWIEIVGKTRSHAAKLADALEEHLPGLGQAWEKTSMPAEGFAWPNSMWAMLAILVGTYGVSRHCLQSTPGPVHAGSGKPYWAGGHEEVSAEHMMWLNGFLPGDAPIANSSFWYGYSRVRGHFKNFGDWNKERSSVLAAIAWGATDIESIAKTPGLAVELSADRTREIVASAIEIGLIECRDDKLRLTFPVLSQNEDEVLFPMVDAVSSRLCREIVEPAAANLTDLLNTLGYGHLEEQYVTWQESLKGKVVGESLRELMSRGVLPDFGECAPANFAMVGCKAPIRLFSRSA